MADFVMHMTHSTEFIRNAIKLQIRIERRKKHTYSRIDFNRSRRPSTAFHRPNIMSQASEQKLYFVIRCDRKRYTQKLTN